MANYDQFEASVLTEGMTSEQKLRFHREMSDAWRDPKQASRLKFWLGGIGAHHFYLGNQSKGMTFLLLCWTSVPVIISLFESNIDKRTQRVNSDLAMRIATRIKGLGPTSATVAQSQSPSAAPIYPQAPSHIQTPSYPPTQSPQAPSYVSAAPDYHQAPVPDSSFPSAQPSPGYAAASSYAPPTPTGSSNTKRWVLAGVAGLLALVIVAGLVGRTASEAKEPDNPKAKVATQTPAPVLTPVPQVQTPSPEPAPAPAPVGDDKYHGHDSYATCMAAAKEIGAATWNCTTAEFEREDRRLNLEYKRVMAQYKLQGQEDKIAALRKVQIAWLKSMTTECDSMGLPQATYGCRLDWTQKRADELAKLP